jgi:AraC family transcriptional regulator
LGTGYIDSAQYTKSICIYLSQTSIAEANTVLSANRDYDFDNYLDNYFTYPHFADHISNFDQSELSVRLKQLRDNFKIDHFTAMKDNINEEWFFDLAEKIILFEGDLCKALNGINSVKFSTRKETLRRLYEGKKFIDENFLKNPGIGEIAKFCRMSEFHFYRTFRQAFRLSPYQYMMKKRLEFSTHLINKSSARLAEIAISCGFGDAFTFSKAFKRYYGIAPSMSR